MLSWEIRSYRQASQHSGAVFFDRGIPDLVGYYLLLGQPVPAHVTAAAQLFRYHPRVFIAPPWPQIYTTDSERHQDFAEAVRTHDAMVAAYTQHGYELSTLPRSMSPRASSSSSDIQQPSITDLLEHLAQAAPSYETSLSRQFPDSRRICASQGC